MPIIQIEEKSNSPEKYMESFANATLHRTDMAAAWCDNQLQLSDVIGNIVLPVWENLF